MSGSTVSMESLDFDRVPVQTSWSSGAPFTKWVRVGMPRLSKRILLSTFFLFSSQKDAEGGENPIGTGFFVSVPTRWPGMCHVYAVTNWHVAIRDGGSVIGLNKVSGGVDAASTEPTDWFWDPMGDDLAVIPIAPDPDVHEFAALGIDIFLTENHIKKWDVGFGDDVFMLGLFVDHTSRTQLVPKARFGNISMMPTEHAAVTQPNGQKAWDFIMDMHSRTGFSGSPVFMFRTPGADLTFITDPKEEVEKDPRKYTQSDPIFCFAGIHWGQFPETFKIKRHGVKTEEVEGMSGLTCVIPAWRIHAFLHQPRFIQMRKVVEDAYRAINPAIDSQPVGESVQPRAIAPATPPATRENPTHKEDFDGLLQKAARTAPKNLE